MTAAARIPRCPSCEGMTPRDTLYVTCDECLIARGDLAPVPAAASYGDANGFGIGDAVIVAVGRRDASPSRRRIDNEPARISAFCGPPDPHGHARAVLSTCGQQPIVPVCELEADS